MELIASFPQAIRERGYAWRRGFLDGQALQELRAELAGLVVPACRGGIRHIEQYSGLVHELIRNGAMAALACAELADAPALVRAILFDKPPTQNWLVSWHQDRTVSANEPFTDSAWGPWSSKDGEWHVQAPTAVLSRMLTMRLHLDDCGSENGPLQVLPGSHLAGVASAPPSEMAEAQVCEARAGDVLLMSPLLWHASSKARIPAARRILHVEYACPRGDTRCGWRTLESLHD